MTTKVVVKQNATFSKLVPLFATHRTSVKYCIHNRTRIHIQMLGWIQIRIRVTRIRICNTGGKLSVSDFFREFAPFRKNSKFCGCYHTKKQKINSANVLTNKKTYFQSI